MNKELVLEDGTQVVLTSFMILNILLEDLFEVHFNCMENNNDSCSAFVFHRIIDVWNNMMMSKWQNFFRFSYIFIIYCICFSIRAHTADTIGLWEDLHQSNDELNLKKAIEKFTLNPFKATQGYHIESLPDLVRIHREKKLPMRYSIKFVFDTRMSNDYRCLFMFFNYKIMLLRSMAVFLVNLCLRWIKVCQPSCIFRD